MPAAAGRSFAAELTALNAALAAPRGLLGRLLVGQKCQASWP